MSRADGRGRDPATDHIRAVLRVVPPSSLACQVLESGGHHGTVTRNVIEESDGTRRCRAEVTDGDGRRLLESAVGDGCICPALQEHDCIVSVDGFDDGALCVSVSTDDREELSAIVSTLRSLGATVHLEYASQANDDAVRQSFELAVDDLTAKQRETLRLAVESGYYDRPRRTDLGALADQFDVSRSAVSQRLSAVESKLVRELVDAMGPEEESARPEP